MNGENEELTEQEQQGVITESLKKYGEQVKEQQKEAIKDAIKQKAKTAMLSLMKTPYFWIVIGIIALLIIFFAAADYIINKNQNDSTNKSKKATMSIAGGLFQVDKNVKEYKYKFVGLTSEEKEKIKALLEKEGFNQGKLKDESDKPIYFTDEEMAILYKLIYADEKNPLDIKQYTEEDLHCLPLFFKSELVTMFPYLGGWEVAPTDLQGNVYIQRHKSNGTVGLTYRPEDEFNGWVESNDKKALEHFTIDGENNLIIANEAKLKEEYSYEGYDESEKTSNSETVTISTIEIKYQSLISKYTVPFEFLLPILVITDNAKFCTDIANEIINNTKITIGIYDNTTTVINEYYEQKHINYEERYDCVMEYKYDEGDTKKTATDVINNFYQERSEEYKNKTEIYTTETTTNVIAVDSANTIFFDMVQTYYKEALPDDVSTTPETVNIEDTNVLVSGPDEFGVRPSIEKEIEDQFESRLDISGIAYSYVDLKTMDPRTKTYTYATKYTTTASGKTTTKKYEYKKDTATDKTYQKFKDDSGFYKRFIQDDNSTKQVRRFLFEVKDRLFDMLSDNMDFSETYINIMKYIFYLYTGKDYGVTDINSILDIFSLGEFTSLGGMTGDNSGFWWPIELGTNGKPISTTITSPYGNRNLGGSISMHNGIDISVAKGTDIIAVKDGTVTKIQEGFLDGKLEEQYKAQANYVIIKHNDGTESRYWHLDTVNVQEGQAVKQGDTIGTSGNSGYSSGPHLHFEIRDSSGNPVNPQSYISSSNPRPVATAGASLKNWLWKIEGGSQYINGNTWIVFDPAGSGDNTMNLAHGMVIADRNGAESWYPTIIPGKIYVGQTVTDEQANKVWEVKIKSFCDAIDKACVQYNVTLNTNQRDALISCIYRLGYGKDQNLNLVKAYKDGGNAGLWSYMKNTYHKSYQEGTKNRLAEEYELFVNGDYQYDYTGTKKYNQFCNNPNI